MKLEVSGCRWACLGSSRAFEHRHVLVGQSCRCRVGIAHSEVVEVREQFSGQGDTLH